MFEREATVKKYESGLSAYQHYVMKDKHFQMQHLHKLAFWLESVGYQILGFLMAFFTPVAGFIGALVFLVVLDAVTGVQAARHRKEKINRESWSRGIVKVRMYCGTLLGGHAIWFFMLRDTPFDLNISYGIALQLMVAELLSVNENMKQVTGVGISLRMLDPLLDRFRKKKE